jgi:hypothetical protein
LHLIESAPEGASVQIVSRFARHRHATLFHRMDELAMAAFLRMKAPSIIFN